MPVRYKFQEQEHDTSTGWIAFKWRNYNRRYRRFFNIDPLAEKYVYNSTFAFSENAVVGHRELEGLEKLKVAISKFIVNEEKPETIKYDNRGMKQVTRNGNYNETLDKVPEGRSEQEGMSFNYDISSGEKSDTNYTNTRDTWVGEVGSFLFGGLASGELRFGDPNYVSNDIKSETSENGSTLSGEFDGIGFNISFSAEDGTLSINSTADESSSGFVIKIGEVNGSSSFSITNGHLEKNKSINFKVDENNNIIFDHGQKRELQEEDSKEKPIKRQRGS